MGFPTNPPTPPLPQHTAFSFANMILPPTPQIRADSDAAQPTPAVMTYMISNVQRPTLLAGGGLPVGVSPGTTTTTVGLYPICYLCGFFGSSSLVTLPMAVIRSLPPYLRYPSDFQCGNLADEGLKGKISPEDCTVITRPNIVQPCECSTSTNNNNNIFVQQEPEPEPPVVSSPGDNIFEVGP